MDRAGTLWDFLVYQGEEFPDLFRIVFRREYNERVCAVIGDNFYR